MTLRLLAGCGLIVVAAASAQANSAVDLRLRLAPAPRSLSMRKSPLEPARPGSGPRGRESTETSASQFPQAVVALLDVSADDLADRVRVHFNLGFGVDASEPSGDPLASGAALVEGDRLSEGQFYEPLRLYTFGDAIIGTRGLIIPSLTTYFGSQFRLNRDGTPPSSAVPSVYDAGGGGGAVIPYATYAELGDIFANPTLRPLYFRAGRQFQYGVAPIHFDGVSIGYNTASVSVNFYGGQRVSLWGLHKGAPSTEVDDLMMGADMRIDFKPVVAVPAVVSASALLFNRIANLESALAVRVTRWLLVSGKLRLRDSNVARESLTVRAQVGGKTTLFASLDNRHDSDWTYDLAVASVAYSDDDPRRLLSLGVPLPRIRLTVRAATVLFDNIDLLGRSTVAAEYANRDEHPANAFARTYYEFGGSAAVRFRRALRVGASALWRGYGRSEFSIDNRVAGLPDPLPNDTGSLGERGFFEGDLTIQYHLGKRQFRVGADFYGRIYRDPFEPGPFLRARQPQTTDARLGSRFALEAEVNRRLRVRGEYDTVFAPAHIAPELRGPKTLRIVLEGYF